MPRLAPGNDGRTARYLRRNEKVWTPPHVITFDSEAWRHQRQHGEDQKLRLWCARLDDRRPPPKKAAQQLRATGVTGADLAATVDAWAVGRETIWLYAHNLGYDLTLTQLVEHLAAIGWTLQSCSTQPDYLFLFLAKGKKRLTMTDMHHLLPMRLAAIGELMGIDKLPMPRDDATEQAWVTYCARDVDVLAAAVLALMAHWDDYQLGNWAVSGAACGFRAMRHMLPPKSLVVFDDPESSAMARAAIYGGRRYCWRHGEQAVGRYSELDFTAAHATTAASYPMPVKAGGWFDGLPLDHMAIDSPLAVVIAEVEVETDRPRFPLRSGDRIWYPVGRFKTVMASPEIRWARETGCLRSIGRGQFHYTAWTLRPFFERVLDIGNPRNDAWPPVVRALWKQWGRSVIGKFAQRGYAITDTGMLTDKIWHYEKAFDWQTQSEYWLVHYGGTIHAAREDGDGASAYPAVLAVVESYERAALGRAADLIGDDCLIQCDTDGMWVDVGRIENGAHTGLGWDLTDIDRSVRVEVAIGAVNDHLGALQLREKHSVQRMAVWGPQNIDAGTHTKHSGRPSGMREIRDGVWAGDTFPSVAYQMSRSEPGTYKTEAVTWTRPANVVPGWVLADGTVRPVEAMVLADGTSGLLPWQHTRWHAAGDCLGPIQHDALDNLWHHPYSPQEVSTP